MWQNNYNDVLQSKSIELLLDTLLYENSNRRNQIYFSHWFIVFNSIFILFLQQIAKVMKDLQPLRPEQMQFHLVQVMHQHRWWVRKMCWIQLRQRYHNLHRNSQEKLLINHKPPRIMVRMISIQCIWCWSHIFDQNHQTQIVVFQNKFSMNTKNLPKNI